MAGARRRGTRTRQRDQPTLLQAAIFEIVDTQIRDGTPPATRRTLERLVASGYTRDEARRLIALVVLAEVHEVLAQQRPFDERRLTAALERLPSLDLA